MNNLGIKIKEARKLKKLTQDELAKRVGVSKHAIAKYEQGQREPNLSILSSLIKELELDFLEVEKSKEEANKTNHEESYILERRNLAQEWIKVSGKTKVLNEFIKNCDNLAVTKRLRDIESQEYMNKLEKMDAKEDDPFKENIFFQELRSQIYSEIREAVLFTIELKLKEAEKTIKEYCEKNEI